MSKISNKNTKEIKTYNYANYVIYLGLALLQGCATEVVPVSSISSQIPSQFFIQQTNSNTTDIMDWWERLKNPELTALIKSAQDNSSDISKARVALKSYEAQVVAARAKTLPSVAGVASASRANTQALATTSSVGLQTSWEIDLFGFNELNYKAQNILTDNAKAQLYQAHTVVAAEVARSYFNYGYCQKAVDILQKDYDSRAIQTNLVRLNVQYGLDNGASLFLSEAALAQTQSNIVEQKSKCESEIKGLVALTGRDERVLRTQLMLSGVLEDTLISPGVIPAELIQKRPDIYSAYQNIQAKALAVGVARGKSYPSIAFSGNILATSISTGGMDISGATWSIGPLSISFPIFDGGVIKANEALALETYESSKKEFLSTLRTAIREIETSYITLNAAQEKSRLNKISINGYEKALDASTARYNIGISNLYELEDSRRSYFNALNADISIQSSRMNAWIDLYKAMGGGFIKE